MVRIIPDREWYLGISDRKRIKPRCPFATVEACPRFYQGMALLGDAGSTKIDPDEDQRLLEKWERSDLWPRTREQASSISGPDGRVTAFSNFCPEVAFERFGYFATNLFDHADSLDRDFAHRRLAKDGASGEDWGWAWSHVAPMHYSECPLYSVLLHRSTQISPTPAASSAPSSIWDRYGQPIIVGLVVTVLSGVILALL